MNRYQPGIQGAINSPQFHVLVLDHDTVLYRSTDTFGQDKAVELACDMAETYESTDNAILDNTKAMYLG